MAGTSDDPTIDTFDNPHWWPLELVHQLLWQRLGDPHLAALDLTEALATFVPSMTRSPTRFSGRRILPLEFWNEHELAWDDHCLVVRRLPKHALDRIDVLKGLVGYAWLPKLAECWPSIFMTPVLVANSMVSEETSSGVPSGEEQSRSKSEPVRSVSESKLKTATERIAKQYAEGEKVSFEDFRERLTTELGRKVTRVVVRDALEKYAPELKMPRGRPINPNRSK
jgi:hypothetical protein